MDFDGDGIGDILSGSYEGDLYFFKGKGKGEFAAPVKLQRDGKNINLGASSTVFAVDWRGTGRLDLLVGNMPGDLYLIPNDGTREKPVYGAPRRLEADGRPIPAPHHGDSQPIAADWDGDGLFDLLVAWGDGSVVWYRNIGSRTEPKLAKGVTLIGAAPAPIYDANAPPSQDIRSGVRAKICAVDWIGDGRLDLLLGDFGGIYGAKAQMSDQDKKAEAEANRSIRVVAEEDAAVLRRVCQEAQVAGASRQFCPCPARAAQEGSRSFEEEGVSGFADAKGHRSHAQIPAPAPASRPRVAVPAKATNDGSRLAMEFAFPSKCEHGKRTGFARHSSWLRSASAAGPVEAWMARGTLRGLRARLDWLG